MAAFTVTALALGGFTLYNLFNATDSSWALDPQTRLENVVGNKNANINYKNLISYWRPLRDPTRFQATSTYERRMMARVNSMSENPARRRKGQRDIIKYNYRLGSGYGVAPQRDLEKRWA